MGPRRSRERRNRQHSWRMLLLGVATIVAILLGIRFGTDQFDRTPITYAQFKTLLKAGQIESAYVSPSRIDGTVKASAASEGNLPGTEFTVRRGGFEKDDALLSLFEQHHVVYDAMGEPNIARLALAWIIPLALVGLTLFLLFQRRFMAPGSGLSFGRSRARLYAQDEFRITFQDVAGIEEAVDELREVVDFLKTPEKYQALGGRIPKGVLLVGPPGTGKTLLAKAVAGEAGVPFFGLSGSDFVEMFVGVGAARVRDLFSQAEDRAPCIIFIDELDALGKSRGGGSMGGHDEREQTLNQLLVEMDGFDSDRGVIIMAASNRPETLDAALLRPGRFDRTVVVDRPDINGREAILRVHARDVKMDDALDLRSIAALTPGLSGAELENLVNEAALLAARAGSKAVHWHHFEEAIERGVAGLERKKRVMQPEEKRRIAYHECGHAIVAYLLPGSDPVHKISIIPRGVAALGYTLQRPIDDRYLATRNELYNKICTLLGGTIAEELVFPEISTGAQNDLQRVSQIARGMVKEFGMSAALGKLSYSDRQTAAFLSQASATASTREYSEATARQIDEEVRAIVDDATEHARSLLTSYRRALEELTRLLLEAEVLDAERLRDVMQRFRPESPEQIDALVASNPIDSRE